MFNPKWVEIAAYDPADAEATKILLEENNVLVCLKAKNKNTFDKSDESEASISVFVSEDQLQLAEELLQDFGRSDDV